MVRVLVTKVDHKQHRSFESAHWRTIFENKTMNILSLYDLILSKTEITKSMFIDDLTDYFTKWMASYRNIMICGDFNMHIAGLTEAQTFNDNMEALGLQQHVNFESHHVGNILDLLSEGKKH